MKNEGWYIYIGNTKRFTNGHKYFFQIEEGSTLYDITYYTYDSIGEYATVDDLILGKYFESVVDRRKRIIEEIS